MGHRVEAGAVVRVGVRKIVEGSNIGTSQSDPQAMCIVGGHGVKVERVFGSRASFVGVSTQTRIDVGNGKVIHCVGLGTAKVLV